MEELIITYGYAIIFAGTFLEGETILILAGFLAHRGYLDPVYVVLSAFLGSLSGDQLYFFIGRYRGAAVLARRPRWKEKAAVINRFLERYSVLAILSFRFLYGLRTVSPFVIGMSKVPTARFMVLNALSALVWSALIGGLGYLFGHTVEIIIGDIKKIEMAVIILLMAVFVAVALYRYFRRRKRNDKEDAP